MNDLSQETDRALQAGRSVLVDNRLGGRHRRTASIGRGSAELKMQHWLKRGLYLGGAILGIVVATGIAGLVLGGIGFWGIMLLALAIMAAFGVFAFAPSPKPPKRSDLNTGDPKQMVARTELWLEAQRPQLPAPAVQLIDDLGVKLDTLGVQLETAPADHQAIREIRELVGENLPEMVESYTRVPQHLRTTEHAGATPDDQLVEGLSRISGEIDEINRQLAVGALDDLAVKHRYLGYRYGEGVDVEPADRAN